MKATLEPDAPKVLTPPDRVAEIDTQVEAPVEVSDANGSSPEVVAADTAETDTPA